MSATMTATAIQPYLTFSGRTDEAIAFYQRTLGAKVDMVIRFNESPQPMPPGMLKPGFENKVMHASFRIGEAVVMASDGCGDEGGFKGFSLSLNVPTEADADKAFNALVDGGSGKVTMPIGKTFWSPRFGMVVDKFGVSWMVGVPGKP